MMLARENNIVITAGTDVDEKKIVQREMKLLVKEYSFTPWEAIICCTKIAPSHWE